MPFVSKKSILEIKNKISVNNPPIFYFFPPYEKPRNIFLLPLS